MIRLNSVVLAITAGLCGFILGWGSVQLASGLTLHFDVSFAPAVTPLERLLIDELEKYPAPSNSAPNWEDYEEYDPAKEFIDIKCLHEAVYYEAGNQPRQGKIAVAEVIYNRVNDHRFPDNFCDVINQPNQFSFTLFENTYNVDRQAWQDAEEIAVEIYFKDRVSSKSLWYHADYINPPVWTKQLKSVDHIGRHIFYEEN